MTITLSVLEGGKVLATKPMRSLERSASALTAGGFDDEGRKEVELEVSLLTGHEYELRLTAKCEAASGLLPATASCVYGAREVGDKAFVEWEFRRITFEP